jgi:hypothetical protein
MDNVMVDLETLGVTSDAVIISIGAIEFELHGEYLLGKTFYRSVSIDSNLELKRHISEDTLIWWLQQSTDAQKVFHEAKTTLLLALRELSDWFPRDAMIWSNGASFDIPMIEHAMKDLHIEPPWAHWNSRCMRTLRGLPGAKAVEKPSPRIAHNALEDATAQAIYVQRLHRHFFGPKAAVMPVAA